MLSEINFENATSSFSALWEFEYLEFQKINILFKIPDQFGRNAFVNIF